MADLTRWRRGAVALLLVAAAAGCSVPSSGTPVVVGPAPTGTNVGDNNPDPGDIPTPDEYQGNPKAMVEAYLKAAVAAAANSDDPAKPAAAQSQFLAGKTVKPAAGPNAPTSITIYAPWRGASVTDIPAPTDAPDPEATWLSLDVVQIGVFEPSSGILTPLSGAGRKTLTFEVGAVGAADKEPGPQGSAVRIKSLTPGSTNLIALDSYMRAAFPPHYIYWWNKTHDAVVPDLRYLAPQTPVRYATQVVNLVLGGEPAPWITPAVEHSIVPGATLQDPLVGLGANPLSYSVNLVPAAGGNKWLPWLAAQLRMSIGDDGRQNPGDPPPLELLVAGQSPVADVGSNFRTLAKNYLQVRTSAQAYMIDAGKIRPVNFDNDGQLEPVVDRELPQTLQNPANANVEFGAVGRDPRNVAIVHETAGKQTLSLIRDRVAGNVTLKATTGFARPAWLPGSDGKTLLVVAGGQFYLVDAANKPHPVSGAAHVTAFSVAPDGERVAYVSQGNLYLAVLTTGPGSPSLTPGLKVNVEQWLDSVSTVSWGTSIYGLLVGGGSTVIVGDIYGTAAVSEVYAKVGTSVTRLASFMSDPFLPTASVQAGPMMEASGRVFTTPPSRIGPPLKSQQKDGLLAPFFSD